MTADEPQENDESTVDVPRECDSCEKSLVSFSKERLRKRDTCPICLDPMQVENGDSTPNTEESSVVSLQVERGSEDDVRAMVGLLAVSVQGVSISRGAEIAGLPVGEFREYIAEHGGVQE